MNTTPYMEREPDENGVIVINEDELLATLELRADPDWLRAAWRQHGIDLDSPISVLNCHDDQVVSLFVDLCGFDMPAAWGPMADALADRLWAMYPDEVTA